MELSEAQNLVSGLTDLELAALLCLVSESHCIVETLDNGIDDVSKELALICQNMFGLPWAVVDCSEDGFQDFAHAVLVNSTQRAADHSKTSSLKQPFFGFEDLSSSKFDESRVPNVVIAKHLNYATDSVQVQALQLILSGRLTTSTTTLYTPSPFILIPVVSLENRQPRLSKHLIDHILFSHFHDPEDGYPNLEDDDWMSDDQASLSSVVHKKHTESRPLIQINEEIISSIRYFTTSVVVTPEVAQYAHNIVVFLRLHRAVAGGISARSGNDLLQLAKCLAPLHGIDYLTPSIVALAAKKAFRHRVRIAGPEDDRSIQYGSDVKVIAHILKDIDSDSIIEHVLSEVEPPL
ncbi:hypothetical protein VTN31DRAFT_4393 [Thermomyces dupontii]|uniref:uncharacterized protein n=1 Tax=Talaromyces thermophilus TaxID=28565 RepID=UPI0037448FA9